jgi:hypothetical protein
MQRRAPPPVRTRRRRLLLRDRVDGRHGVRAAARRPPAPAAASAPRGASTRPAGAGTAISSGRGTRRVRLVRGEGRGVSDQYGVRDAVCPLSTRGGGREGGYPWSRAPSRIELRSSGRSRAPAPGPPGEGGSSGSMSRPRNSLSLYLISLHPNPPPRARARRERVARLVGPRVGRGGSSGGGGGGRGAPGGHARLAAREARLRAARHGCHRHRLVLGVHHHLREGRGVSD